MHRSRFVARGLPLVYDGGTVVCLLRVSGLAPLRYLRGQAPLLSPRFLHLTSAPPARPSGVSGYADRDGSRSAHVLRHSLGVIRAIQKNCSLFYISISIHQGGDS